MALKTALYDEHVAAGAKMVEFGGWDMPVQYDGVLLEHARVRESVGMFDTSHMNALWIDGLESLEALSYILTQNLRTLAVGGCRYGFMLNESGGTLDDLIVYRMDESAWMLVVNAGTASDDLAWIQRHCAGKNVQVRDLRQEQAKLDVQGPAALATLKDVLDIDAAALRRFRWMTVTVDGARWIVSRTGYTGEDGVELYVPHSALVTAWRRLSATGVKPCGLGARDTLRLEAGYPLYGHELDAATSPAEAGLLRYCSKDEPFIGREALLRRASQPAAALTPFRLQGRQSARHGQLVRRADGTELGRVTSGSYAPTLGYAIGFAYVPPQEATPGTQWLIDNGRSLLPATALALPFL